MTDPLIETEEQTSCWNSDDPQHCKKLPAEMAFDKAVYGGISYWAQAITGIVLTKWLRHGSGRKHFDKMANWVGPNFIEKVSSKRGKAAIDAADYWITVSTMVNVGNAFLLPVKWLENNKPQWVRSINDRMNKKREAKGETISAEELAYQEAHLKALDSAPKQSWWSLVIGRAFGLGVVYTALPLIGKNNKIMEDFTVEQLQKGVSATGLEAVAKSKTFEDYSRIAFYDLVYSAFSASGLYVYSHFFHPKEKRQVTLSDAVAENSASVPVTEEKTKKSQEKPPASYVQKIAAEERSTMQPGVSA